MEWSYEYTHYIWLMLVSVVSLALLGINGIRHRSAPGGVPFIIMMALAIPWVLANDLVLAATDGHTKVFWWNFQIAFLLPLVAAELCFGLEYAGLGKWVNRRVLVLFAIVPAAFVPLIFTNEIHHLVWKQIWFDGYVRFIRGPANWVAIGYGYFLSLLTVMVLVWLFTHSPRHRPIAAALIIASLSVRGATFLNMANWNPIEPLNPVFLTMNLALLPYGLAIFRFRMFDVVPVARDTIIERMADGMMVLDTENRIADVNESAQALLGIEKSKVIGRRVAKVLRDHSDLVALVGDSNATQGEVPFGKSNIRWVQLSLSPLIDRRGFHLGRLIWFHDISEQRRAQEQMVDQQRTLAMLQERELLARELHDGIGQMLAAAHLQVKSASELLARGERVLAESCLRRVTDVTQEAKETIRTYLHGVKNGSTGGQGLVSKLRRDLQEYSRNYDIPADLVVSPELDGKRIDAAVEAQLQPIIQEALTNVRRHGGAASVRVIFASCDGEVRVTIEDDGRGFDPEGIRVKQGFGLRSMRGRAEAAGGLLEINSTPGKGTRVIVRMPWQNGRSHENPARG